MTSCFLRNAVIMPSRLTKTKDFLVATIFSMRGFFDYGLFQPIYFLKTVMRYREERTNENIKGTKWLKRLGCVR